MKGQQGTAAKPHKDSSSQEREVRERERETREIREKERSRSLETRGYSGPTKPMEAARWRSGAPAPRCGMLPRSSRCPGGALPATSLPFANTPHMLFSTLISRRRRLSRPFERTTSISNASAHTHTHTALAPHKLPKHFRRASPRAFVIQTSSPDAARRRFDRGRTLWVVAEHGRRIQRVVNHAQAQKTWIYRLPATRSTGVAMEFVSSLGTGRDSSAAFLYCGGSRCPLQCFFLEFPAFSKMIACTVSSLLRMSSLRHSLLKACFDLLKASSPHYKQSLGNLANFLS